MKKSKKIDFFIDKKKNKYDAKKNYFRIIGVEKR